jgi:SEC-C motif
MNVINRKVGRNERCPCGSGRKYKHCCGSYTTKPPSSVGPQDEKHLAFQRVIAEHTAKETRRRQQQGLGRPIISTEFAGHRIVAVGHTVRWSTQWKTFHDFLFDYIKEMFGREWGSKEQQRPLDKRHILLRWAHEISEYHELQKALTPDADILSTPSTPVLSAYLGLAYNLYLMKHNARLQKALISRLKNPDESSFHGAYYETFVAATFIKAGYEIDFENEQDGRSTHCEFVAALNSTNRKFSVEAKARFRGDVASGVDPVSLKLGVRDKIEAALQKKADHTRVVFIDVNLPEIHAENRRPFWVDAAIAEARDLETTMIAAGQDVPTAYIVITNHPYQFESTGGISAVMEGFNIPEFKLGARFTDLHAAIEARDRHANIQHVFESMQKYFGIPSTFDGEMPETHFQRPAERAAPLKIGNRYLVPNENGFEVPAELENAVVIEQEKKAVGVCRLDNGCRIVALFPLSDREVEAYQRHPDTFFGVVDQNARSIFDWYDFFFASYGRTPKEKLLEFMKDAADIEVLKTMPQQEIAKAYCERLALGVDRRSKHSPDGT